MRATRPNRPTDEIYNAKLQKRRFERTMNNVRPSVRRVVLPSVEDAVALAASWVLASRSGGLPVSFTRN